MADPLIDTDYMRDTFRISDDVADARITPYLRPASRRLQAWVGADTYANEDEAETLKLAEGLLAMHLMVLNLNTSVRPEGLVRTEQVENNVTLSYQTPAETAAFGQMYLEQAQEILGDLVLNDGTPGVPYAFGECS